MTDPDEPDRPSEAACFVRAILDAPEDPAGLLAYSDWLEERGATRHADLARLLVSARWHRVPRLKYMLCAPDGAILAEVAWWEKVEGWFWKARGNKGVTDSVNEGKRKALLWLLTHRGFDCCCKRATL